MSSREYAELIQFALDSGRPDLAMMACHALQGKLQRESDLREEEMMRAILYGEKKDE